MALVVWNRTSVITTDLLQNRYYATMLVTAFAVLCILVFRHGVFSHLFANFFFSIGTNDFSHIS